MKKIIENLNLHYKIDLQFIDTGKDVKQIIKDNFYIYLKDLKKGKNYESNDKIIA